MSHAATRPGVDVGDDVEATARAAGARPPRRDAAQAERRTAEVAEALAALDAGGAAPVDRRLDVYIARAEVVRERLSAP
ncbi:MAG: hypothetical protein V7607_2503 [Solirubrobacteraceae bacterium]